MINFFKQIFTWWHRTTIGTFFYTVFFGKYAGSDQFGNKYYFNEKKKKRWVIYKDIVESTKIPPAWHLWIHFLKQEKPPNNLNKFSWQKPYQENLTGTKNAYKPEGSLSSELKKNIKKYESWKI